VEGRGLSLFMCAVFVHCLIVETGESARNPRISGRWQGFESDISGVTDLDA
jgi:hypothetical protein